MEAQVIDKEISLRNIMKAYNIDVGVVATAMFDYDLDKQCKGFELRANARVYKALKLEEIGKPISINVGQLSRLANAIGVPLQDIIDVGLGEEWKGETHFNQGMFVKGDYKVLLDTKTCRYSLIYKNKPIKHLVGFSGLMTVEQFLENINNIIKEFENGTNQNDN